MYSSRETTTAPNCVRRRKNYNTNTKTWNIAIIKHIMKHTHELKNCLPSTYLFSNLEKTIETVKHFGFINMKWVHAISLLLMRNLSFSSFSSYVVHLNSYLTFLNYMNVLLLIASLYFFFSLYRKIKKIFLEVLAWGSMIYNIIRVGLFYA